MLTKRIGVAWLGADGPIGGYETLTVSLTWKEEISARPIWNMIHFLGKPQECLKA